MLKSWFSRLSRGWKGKKSPKMSKISVCHTLYFRNYISYDLYIWYTCMYKRIISWAIFFIFFKILIFRIIRGGWSAGKWEWKGKKWPKMTKKFVHISGTIHHMIVIFGAHVWNDDISSKYFHFSKFWVLRFLGG